MAGGDIDPVAAARAWIGTPYRAGAALRGVGCDCVGLVRGVLRDVTGRHVPAPHGWRADWAAAPGAPLLDAARRHLIELKPAEARPGDVVAFRMGGARVAHCGILTDAGRVVHAAEGVGVVEVTLAAWRGRIAFCARFPVRFPAL
ncbi:DUF6950 family protein [Oceanicella actignis]|uniref:Putative phage cell wall peptidase, NlpC/P60 family n=1 Tax=Oceanicella actignis TaxID=1189325 RepID=A0A1M7U1Q6_9RHOB|nr:NlpC/P60 family protein [Oceanicella actignis]SES76922.1 putative phage cell wall peptidase, NlpC/P60 family [Oceanicella actignis]SHN76878.1 putative phage cell wall peptidase, NlpC/P60 family [Oceanicella actignis]